MSGRERANGRYHRETGRHCESPRERKREMNDRLNDEKFMQAALVIDGALAGVAAFYSIPAALFMMALLIYAAINL